MVVDRSDVAGNMHVVVVVVVVRVHVGVVWSGTVVRAVPAARLVAVAVVVAVAAAVAVSAGTGDGLRLGYALFRVAASFS